MSFEIAYFYTLQNVLLPIRDYSLSEKRTPKVLEQKHLRAEAERAVSLRIVLCVASGFEIDEKGRKT